MRVTKTIEHMSKVKVKILSQQKIGCGGHLVFQNLLKINTSQAYATLYPYKTFGEDIFITFPLIDRTSSIFWVSKNLPVAAILFCSSKIAENQYQPSHWHHRHAKIILWWYLNNFFFKWSDKVSCGRLTHHAWRRTGTRTQTICPPPGDIIMESISPVQLTWHGIDNRLIPITSSYD